ncbi:MAG: hypothetical protein WB682_01675 [Candidatus Dormiibacterota bacterium]
MKIKRAGQSSETERRRNLAEVNLLVERSEKAPPSRKGCILPFIGVGVTLLAALAAAAGLAL